MKLHEKELLDRLVFFTHWSLVASIIVNNNNNNKHIYLTSAMPHTELKNKM